MEILLNLIWVGVTVSIGIVEEEALSCQTKGFLFFISFRDLLPVLTPLKHRFRYMGKNHLMMDWKLSYPA